MRGLHFVLVSLAAVACSQPKTEVDSSSLLAKSPDGLPVLNFEQNGSVTLLGHLQSSSTAPSGRLLKIKYDVLRVLKSSPVCDYRGEDKVTGHAQLTGVTSNMMGNPESFKKIVSFEIVNYIQGESDMGQCAGYSIAEPVLVLPKGTSKVEVWIEAKRSYPSEQNTIWDSKNGANYSFDVAK